MSKSLKFLRNRPTLSPVEYGLLSWFTIVVVAASLIAMSSKLSAVYQVGSSWLGH